MGAEAIPRLESGSLNVSDVLPSSGQAQASYSGPHPPLTMVFLEFFLDKSLVLTPQLPYTLGS